MNHQKGALAIVLEQLIFKLELHYVHNSVQILQQWNGIQRFTHVQNYAKHSLLTPVICSFLQPLQNNSNPSKPTWHTTNSFLPLAGKLLTIILRVKLCSRPLLYFPPTMTEKKAFVVKKML